MTAVEFLDKLEQQGLLDERLVSKLRQQVSESRSSVSAQKIVKLLIDKGHLTPFQAKKLMDDAAKASSRASYSERTTATTAVAEDDGLELVDAEGDDLGLELVDEEAPAVAAEDDGLELIDDTPPAPAAKTPASKAAPSKPAPHVPKDTGLDPLEDVGLTPVDAGPAPIASSAAPADLAGGLEPIDPLASDLASAESMAATSTAPAGKIITGKKVARMKGQSPWDTPLMLLGGGAVIGLVIAAFFLYRWIFATNATEVFTAATDAYRAQSYTQAISIYEDFLSQFPSDPNAAPAWVLIRTARLRQVHEGKNWDRALETAKEVLAEIDQGLVANPGPVKELPAAFNEHGRPELASMLPDIAAGFATQAKNAKTMDVAKERVTLAEDAMTLVNNASYIPTTLRESVAARIDLIQEDIAVAKRNINRDEALEKAIGEMEQALAGSNTTAAFEVRKALVKTYPELDQHPRVVESVRKTTEKERELVALLEEPRSPAASDDSAGGPATVGTAAVNGESAPGVAGDVVAVLARGAVYGLDATSGRVLWRRAIGESNVHPQRVSREPGSDVIFFDGQKHEVVRVDSKTGQVRWRLPIETNAAAPVLVGERLFVAAESGLLYEVDAATGASARQVKFPQPLRSPPAIDEARGLLFQVGEHSNLYILSSETLDCKAAFYLGHRAGTVATPPTLSRGQVFIVENAGADYCLVHTFPTTDDLEKLKPSQAAIRVSGNVIAPPYVYERRVVVVTDLGGMKLFEIDTGNKKQPVSIVAELAATLREPAFGYSLADAGQLWVADARLARYEVQAARGELVRKAIRDEGSVYVSPLQMVGNVLFHARKQTNSEGVLVTAADAATLRPYWVSDLGTPMVGLIAPPGATQVAAVSAQGALYQLPGDGLQPGINSQPKRPAALDTEAAFEPPLALPDGRFIFPGVAQKNRILIFEPTSAEAPKTVELKVAEGSATAAPVPYQGGLLVPSSAGLVYLLDVDTGEELALPLRPPLAPGEEVVWQSPAISADGKEFVIASDQKKAYRVVLRQQPKPHLAALTSRDLDGVIALRMATAGETIYGVERTPQGDSILAFELPSLSFQRTQLAGRAIWGPHQVGGAVLVATLDTLVKLEGGPQPRWTQPLPYGPPVAPPSELNGNYLFASVGGTVWGLSTTTGEESSKNVLGESLAAGPAILGARLFVGGSDGVLHMMTIEGN
jgi:outer membrane protein assembly factor BamB